jgi:hypothetical protein
MNASTLEKALKAIFAKLEEMKFKYVLFQSKLEDYVIYTLIKFGEPTRIYVKIPKDSPYFDRWNFHFDPEFSIVLSYAGHKLPWEDVERDNEWYWGFTSKYEGIIGGIGSFANKDKIYTTQDFLIDIRTLIKEKVKTQELSVLNETDEDDEFLLLYKKDWCCWEEYMKALYYLRKSMTYEKSYRKMQREHYLKLHKKIKKEEIVGPIEIEFDDLIQISPSLVSIFTLASVLEAMFLIIRKIQNKDRKRFKS